MSGDGERASGGFSIEAIRGIALGVDRSRLHEIGCNAPSAQTPGEAASHAAHSAEAVRGD